MARGIYTSAAWTANGGVAIAPNAEIEVREQLADTLATIYVNREGPDEITNPSSFADAFGRFFFFALGIEGGYKVILRQGGEEYALEYQAVGTAGERDIGTESDEVPINEFIPQIETVLEDMGGDFASSAKVFCRKHGNQVTITSKSQWDDNFLRHDNDDSHSDLVSANNVVPENMRPPAVIDVCYTGNSQFVGSIRINSSGRISVWYRNWDGSTHSRTTTGGHFSITYVLDE